MGTLKTYWINSVQPTDKTRAAFGGSDPRRFDVDLIAVATSKTEASEFASDVANIWDERSWRLARTPAGYLADLAGLADGPGTVVASHRPMKDQRILFVEPGGTVSVAGTWQHVSPDSYQMRVVPVGTITVELSRDQVEALRALLGLVRYDDLAQRWRDLLPAELLAAINEKA